MIIIDMNKAVNENAKQFISCVLSQICDFSLFFSKATLLECSVDNCIKAYYLFCTLVALFLAYANCIECSNNFLLNHTSVTRFTQCSLK